jgi:hypothetical protein
MNRNRWDYQPRDLGRSVMLDLPKPLPIWPLNVMVLLLVGVVFGSMLMSGLHTIVQNLAAALASVSH